jgi:hypothetical protein
MTDSNAKPSLDALREMFRSRLQNYEALLKLSGRLDLVLMQVLKRTDEGEAKRMAALVHKPVAMYQLDDDSEAEMDMTADVASSSSSSEGEQEDESVDEEAEEMSVDEE